MKSVPKDGLQGLRQNWRIDIFSGFFVFLLALPLSLGIAQASEFPMAMGILTAMIGGIIVSLFAGSRLTIKGPAAGLITVCAAAIAEFGGGVDGWHLACGVIVVMAALQVGLAILKVGSLSDFFPHSVVHGMLAAIGILIFAKQFPVLLGIAPSMTRGLSPVDLYLHIPEFIRGANAGVALIGACSLVILFLFPLFRSSFVQKIPAPIVVLLLAIPLGMYLGFQEQLDLEGIPKYLVHVGDFWSQIGINADFSSINTWVFWKYVAIFLFVNSLESLLTVKAIDHLDPWKRHSNYDKDLAAIGGGNALSGSLGGLPMIAEVARSSANVTAGARTRWSNFFHGTFLLLAMLFLIPVIEMIPKSALAAMLILVAYKLSSPKEFIGSYKIGYEQLIIFLTTVVVTLTEDLLVGVIAGILVKFLFHFIHGAPWKSLFKADYLCKKSEGEYFIQVRGSATFSNFIGYRKLWQGIKPAQKVIMDFEQARLIDHTFMEQLHHFEEDYTEHGGSVTIRGLEGFRPFSKHPRAARKAPSRKRA